MPLSCCFKAKKSCVLIGQYVGFCRVADVLRFVRNRLRWNVIECNKAQGNKDYV